MVGGVGHGRTIAFGEVAQSYLINLWAYVCPPPRVLVLVMHYRQRHYSFKHWLAY